MLARVDVQRPPVELLGGSWPSTSSVTYGNEKELWGLDAELSPQAVNAPDFGVAYAVRFDAMTSGGVAAVDAITVEVHYCE